MASVESDTKLFGVDVSYYLRILKKLESGYVSPNVLLNQFEDKFAKKLNSSKTSCNNLSAKKAFIKIFNRHYLKSLQANLKEPEYEYFWRYFAAVTPYVYTDIIEEYYGKVTFKTTVLNTPNHLANDKYFNRLLAYLDDNTLIFSDIAKLRKSLESKHQIESVLITPIEKITWDESLRNAIYKEIGAFEPTVMFPTFYSFFYEDGKVNGLFQYYKDRVANSTIRDMDLSGFRGFNIVFAKLTFWRNVKLKPLYEILRNRLNSLGYKHTLNHDSTGCTLSFDCVIPSDICDKISNYIKNLKRFVKEFVYFSGNYMSFDESLYDGAVNVKLEDQHVVLKFNTIEWRYEGADIANKLAEKIDCAKFSSDDTLVIEIVKFFSKTITLSGLRDCILKTLEEECGIYYISSGDIDYKKLLNAKKICGFDYITHCSKFDEILENIDQFLCLEEVSLFNKGFYLTRTYVSVNKINDYIKQNFILKTKAKSSIAPPASAKLKP